ncbi:hypothetical protein [Acinetobacter variabilis]|uniref:Uncharacterized protein n=1 Tax=Acinetobacter variabilis TaxID=70346 RepID=N9NXA8_9GAMM|nr:hypothetical protein [Acinetobacter variabilis]ENX10201.1 hypothetical protein F897_01318 [Acinetobacter variabilis]UBI30402.1 hypothetical protein LA331_14350 [Acinetobacter variabilis]
MKSININDLNRIASKIIEIFIEDGLEESYINGKMRDFKKQNRYETFYWALYNLDSIKTPTLLRYLGIDHQEYLNAKELFRKL